MIPADGLRIAVGIITRGRAAILREALVGLRAQTRPAEAILICHTCDDDVAGLARDGVTLMRAEPGTSLQRNRLLDAASGFDVMLFLDDDFLAAPDYLAATARAFADDPALVVSTGTVLADGANGPGLSPEQGWRRLRDAPAGPGPAPVAAYNGYGCNMAVRLATVRAHGLRFDERLVLYAWYEDIDFSRRVGRFGRIMRLPAARGVHLGVKSGRGPGVRLGYAQVINPLYLGRKGSYGRLRGLLSILRNVAMNAVRAPRPEAYVDRRGRLRGNVLALRDLLRGRLDPGRAQEL